MRRCLVFALIGSFGSSAVFAEETLTQVAARVAFVQLAANATNPVATKRLDAAVTSQAQLWAVRTAPAVAKAEVNAQQEPGTAVLSKSGLRRRTKAMLYLGMAAGFIGAAYAIDHNVQDITPSSLGSRED